MSDTGFRPKTYEQALAYFNERRNKQQPYRTIIHGKKMDEPKGTPSRILEKIVVVGGYDEIDHPTPVLAYQQHGTNIATFYPDGRIEVVGWDSNVSRRRMADMHLPYYQALSNYAKGRRYDLPMYSGCRLWCVKGYPLGLPGDRVVVRREGNAVVLDGSSPTEPVAIPKIDQLRTFNRSRRAMLKVINSWSRMTEAMLDRGPTFTLKFPTMIQSRLVHELRHGGGSLDSWSTWLAKEQQGIDGLDPREHKALLEMAETLTFWEAIPWGDDQYYDKVTVPSSQLKEVLDAVQAQ